jgi:hypothetical protein
MSGKNEAENLYTQDHAGESRRFGILRVINPDQ